MLPPPPPPAIVITGKSLPEATAERVYAIERDLALDRDSPFTADYAEVVR